MLESFYKPQGNSSLLLRGAQPKDRVCANSAVATYLVKAFYRGARFRQTIMPILHSWPTGMQPRIQLAIETVCSSPHLTDEQRKAVGEVALALWRASGNRMLKDDVTPEPMHALGVALRVERMRVKYGFGFEITLAAIMHDAVEDGLLNTEQIDMLVRKTAGSRRLAARVSRWASMMSHAPHIKNEEYAAHMEMVMAEPATRLIKVCDMLDRHTRLGTNGLRESELDKTLIMLGMLYQKYDIQLGAVLENSARRFGLLPH